MIATRFRSVYWVGGVAVAALGCYLVSQRVAAERATLVTVEASIVAGKRDIRALQTEIGTRAGLNQIEKWNADVLSLSAPKAGQFLSSEVQLASLSRPAQPAMDAPTVTQVAAIEPAAAEPGITRTAYRAPEAEPRPAEPRPAERRDQRVAEQKAGHAVERHAARSTERQTEHAEPHASRLAERHTVRPAERHAERDTDRNGKMGAREHPEHAGSRLAAKSPAKPSVKLAAVKLANVKLADKADRSAAKKARAKRTDEVERADQTPRLRQAIYVKPRHDHQSVALLDDRLLGDIDRVAASERAGGKRNR